MKGECQGRGDLINTDGGMLLGRWEAALQEIVGIIIALRFKQGTGMVYIMFWFH